MAVCVYREGVPSECTIVRAIGSRIAGRLKAQEAGEWCERGEKNNLHKCSMQ